MAYTKTAQTAGSLLGNLLGGGKDNKLAEYQGKKLGADTLASQMLARERQISGDTGQIKNDALSSIETGKPISLAQLLRAGQGTSNQMADAYGKYNTSNRIDSAIDAGKGGNDSLMNKIILANTGKTSFGPANAQGIVTNLATGDTTTNSLTDSIIGENNSVASLNDAKGLTEGTIQTKNIAQGGLYDEQARTQGSVRAKNFADANYSNARTGLTNRQAQQVGRERSNRAKIAIDGGLVPGTPEFNEFVLADKSGVNVNIESEPQFGKIPQGMMMQKTPDGGYQMIPVPGGPEDLKRQGLADKKEQSQVLSKRASDVVLEDIGRLKGLVGNEGSGILNNPLNDVTGIAGTAMAKIPGSTRVDAENLAETIAANVGFDRLQQMRDASPTGGALGAISERELSTLQAVLGNIKLSQSQPQLMQNLDRLENIYKKIVHGDAGAQQPQAQPAPDLSKLSTDDIRARIQQLKGGQ